MSKNYSRQEFLEKYEQAARNINELYQANIVNYKGKTSDTKEAYTEIIASLLLQDLSVFGHIRQISGDKPYNRGRHDGNNENKTNRLEEITAKELFNQKVISGYEILDYQVPLRQKKGDSAGKIDVLAAKGDTLYLLELKKECSQETLLRCVLEAETYLRTVDCNKLLSDYSSATNKYTEVKCGPLIYADSQAYKDLEDATGHQNVRQLMKELKQEVFLISAGKDGDFQFEVHQEPLHT